MSGGNEFNDAALWRRWRESQAGAGEAAAEPDTLTLAAYAENRLGRPGIDPETDAAIAAVEAWLVDRPEVLDDVVAARSASEVAAEVALVVRAQTLVAKTEGNVVSLRPARRDWRHAVAWSGIAASMILAVLIGFQLGNEDAFDLDSGQTTVADQALIGSPGTILTTDDEETGI